MATNDLEFLKREGRSGQFTIDDTRLMDSRLLSVFGRMIIVRAEYLYCSHSIQFDAYSPDFEASEPENQIPQYHIVDRGDGATLQKGQRPLNSVEGWLYF